MLLEKRHGKPHAAVMALILARPMGEAVGQRLLPVSQSCNTKLENADKYTLCDIYTCLQWYRSRVRMVQVHLACREQAIISRKLR